MERFVPWLLSVALHLVVIGAVLLVPVTATPRRKPAPIQVDLVDALEPPPQEQSRSLPQPDPPAQVAERPVPRPRPSARPTPRVTPRPRPSPSPSPTPDAMAHKLKTLRQLDEYKNVSDEELRALELPPGLESWEAFVELAKQLNGIPMGVPPDTGESAPPVTEVTWDHQVVGDLHYLTIQAPQGKFWLSWKDGALEAEGHFYEAGNETDKQPVKVLVDQSYQKMVDQMVAPATPQADPTPLPPL